MSSRAEQIFNPFSKASYERHNKYLKGLAKCADTMVKRTRSRDVQPVDTSGNEPEEVLPGEQGVPASPTSVHGPGSDRGEEPYGKAGDAEAVPRKEARAHRVGKAKRRKVEYELSDADESDGGDDDGWCDAFLDFGKHKGSRVSQLVASGEGRGYLRWMDENIDYDKRKLTRLQRAVTYHLTAYAKFVDTNKNA
jgi:hypothetical protein